MPGLVWFNGCTSSLEEATVPAADHAHLYGDGLFEGIRIYGRKVFKLDEHLSRLYDGCKALKINMALDQDKLKAIVLETCRKSDISDGYVRLNVTRGTGLGLDPRAVKTEPNVMVMVSSLSLYAPEMYETGLQVVTTSWRVIPPDALDPRIKCIGRYAANIQAKHEANRAGAGEGLMLNSQGHIAECTGDNVFLVRNGVVSTPHPSCGILQGITRDTIMTLLREEGVQVEETLLTTYDVYRADEAFLTGTAAEVIPMVGLDGQPVGDGKPGPMTKKAIQLFRAHVASGVPFDH